MTTLSLDQVGQLVNRLSLAAAPGSNATAVDRKARDLLYREFGEAGVAAWKEYTNDRANRRNRSAIAAARGKTRPPHRDAGRSATKRHRERDRESFWNALEDPEVRKRVVHRSAEIGIIEIGIIERYPDARPAT